jgi:hypothetical protein
MAFAYLFVLDTMSDWEHGFLTPELNTGRMFREPGASLPVRTVSLTGEPITTMGGLRVATDCALADVTPADAAVLLLPGADTWTEPPYQAVLAKARDFLAAGVPVAAICGATIALADAGMLDSRPHTSNDLEALRQFSPRVPRSRALRRLAGRHRWRPDHGLGHRTTGLRPARTGTAGCAGAGDLGGVVPALQDEPAGVLLRDGQLLTAACVSRLPGGCCVGRAGPRAERGWAGAGWVSFRGRFGFAGRGSALMRCDAVGEVVGFGSRAPVGVLGRGPGGGGSQVSLPGSGRQ